MIVSLRLFLFTTFAALVTTSALAAVSWWPYAVPPAGSHADATILKQSEALLKRINIPADANVLHRADAIRGFVNRHSVHQIDEEFYSYWHNVPTLMTMMARHADAIPPRKTAHDRPHMECASRSAVTYHLLRAAGIDSRFVVVQPGMSTVESHTFLEILNPADGRWTIQDPDANVFWVFADGRRAGVADLLAHPVRETFTPCRSQDDCGFDHYTDMFVPYFAAATLIDPRIAEVPVLYNARRIDPRIVFSFMARPQAYCPLFAGGCRYAPAEIE